MNHPMDENRVKVKSLYKALKLLDYFTDSHTLWGISEVSELESLPKSTVHNIFSTFAVYGILSQDPSSGKYRLGPKIAQLSNYYFASSSSIKAIRSEMEKLASIVNENVYYGTIFEDHVLYLEAVYGTTVSRPTSLIGATAPLHCTGIGKAILAWQRDYAVVDRITQQGLHRFTDTTITTREALLNELDQIQQQGFSSDNMEHELGVKCIAVPIFNTSNTLVGAMSISCPSLRMEGKEEEFARCLTRAQQTLRSLII